MDEARHRWGCARGLACPRTFLAPARAIGRATASSAPLCSSGWRNNGNSDAIVPRFGQQAGGGRASASTIVHSPCEEDAALTNEQKRAGPCVRSTASPSVLLRPTLPLLLRRAVILAFASPIRGPTQAHQQIAGSPAAHASSPGHPHSGTRRSRLAARTCSSPPSSTSTSFPTSRGDCRYQFSPEETWPTALL